VKTYKNILQVEEISESTKKIQNDLETLLFNEIDKMFPVIEKKSFVIAKKYGYKRGTIPLNGLLAHLKKEARSYLPAFNNSFKEIKK